MTVLAPSQRCEASWPFFCAGVCEFQALTLHIAGLAGGKLNPSRRTARGELLAKEEFLPLVVEEDSALPFVIVQSVWQCRLVAGRAKLRGAVEVPHDRFAVAIKVGKDFAVGDLAGDRLAVFIYQYGGHAHNVAARCRGCRPSGWSGRPCR